MLDITKWINRIPQGGLVQSTMFEDIVMVKGYQQECAIGVYIPEGYVDDIILGDNNNKYFAE